MCNLQCASTKEAASGVPAMPNRLQEVAPERSCASHRNGAFGMEVRPSRKEAGWHPRAPRSSHVPDGCRWANLVRQCIASRDAFSEL
jgi:hypothetical protein